MVSQSVPYSVFIINACFIHYEELEFRAQCDSPISLTPNLSSLSPNVLGSCLNDELLYIVPCSSDNDMDAHCAVCMHMSALIERKSGIIATRM